MVKERYHKTRETYKRLNIDTDAAISALSKIPVSMHCWQGDDVSGFEGKGALSGGIAATGNYPGKARNYEELMADIEKALSIIPGRHRLNLHANYAIFDKAPADRDALLPEHFSKWVTFAKKNNLGLDFNGTFFSHPKSENATLSSEDEKIRLFWIEHGKRCLKIAEYFANELGTHSLVDIWIPDGYKDTPADRTAPRARLKNSLDQILASDYDRDKVLVAVESKVFGIGMESYTPGSHEFYMNYVAHKSAADKSASMKNILLLIDNGHYHPTENVADKISSLLLFCDKVALHVTRPVRWDSDHIVLYDDQTREIVNEIIRCGADRVLIGLDYFDASVNRIAAWVIGMRNIQKALLYALLTPHAQFAKLQEERRFTELLALQEELKTYPAGDVWDYFCETNGVPVKEAWLEEVMRYEKDVLTKRV